MKEYLPKELFRGYRVKNAFNPLIWILGVFCSPILVAIIWKGSMNTLIIVFVIIIISLLVAVIIFSYLYLLFKDPDRLQSEDYQIRNRAFDLIENKGENRAIDADTVVSITNPDLPQIAYSEGKVK
jgi:hypothetical protein